MKREIAEGLNKELLEHNKQLTAYFPKLRDELGPEKSKEFSSNLSHMLALSFDVLDIIWAEHQDLMPEEAKL